MREGQTFFPAALFPAIALMTTEAIGNAIDTLIAELDARGGDPDIEPNGDELDGAWSHEETWGLAPALCESIGAGCLIADPGGSFEDDMSDTAWIEWGSRGRTMFEFDGEPLSRDRFGNPYHEDEEPNGPAVTTLPKAAGLRNVPRCEAVA